LKHVDELDVAESAMCDESVLDKDPTGAIVCSASKKAISRKGVILMKNISQQIAGQGSGGSKFAQKIPCELES
jgi:hypothetical protein